MHRTTTLNARGKIIDLETPVVMGILNVTPDSFFDGGDYNAVESALKQANKMIAEGARILDVGGMSSRPGAAIIPSEEELERISPVVEAIRSEYPEICISVDTIHADTAKHVLESGVDIINDISGGRYDDEMLDVVAGYGNVPFICMHMQGLPENMQVAPEYDDVVHEILQFFVERLATCRSMGIKDVILDPGFGFGKTVDHNYEILKKIGVFSILEVPVLAGLSRKSIVNRVLGIPPAKALNGTTVVNTIAVLNGASILRVHDVRQAVEAIELCQYYDRVGENPESRG